MLTCQALSLLWCCAACRYIEACESGSMFEGLLGNDLDIYVTTAANAIESSWATYCPTFYSSEDDSPNNPAAIGITNGDKAPTANTAAADSGDGSSDGGWKAAIVQGLSWLQQQLARLTGAPQRSAADGAGGLKPPAPPAPQFTTCLGDLYSVAWMEDAEGSDLTKETLLQQYKKIKVGVGLDGCPLSATKGPWVVLTGGLSCT